MMKNYLSINKKGGLFIFVAVASITTIGIAPPSKAGTVIIPNGPLTNSPSSNSPKALLNYNLTTVVSTCQLSDPRDGQLALFQNGGNQWIASTNTGLNLTADIPQPASITANSTNANFKIRASNPQLISTNLGVSADDSRTRIVGAGGWGGTSTKSYSSGQQNVEVDVRFRKSGSFSQGSTYRAEVTVTCFGAP
jgi:hypothetical protein